MPRNQKAVLQSRNYLLFSSGAGSTLVHNFIVSIKTVFTRPVTKILSLILSSADLKIWLFVPVVTILTEKWYAYKIKTRFPQIWWWKFHVSKKISFSKKTFRRQRWVCNRIQSWILAKNDLNGVWQVESHLLGTKYSGSEKRSHNIGPVIGSI